MGANAKNNNIGKVPKASTYAESSVTSSRRKVVFTQLTKEEVESIRCKVYKYAF